MKRRILISSIILLSIQTFASAKTLLVPTRTYPNIQSAITSAVNGDTVIVMPGTYTGTGNVNLDFGGKAITVESEINPADPDPAVIAATIIDCGGQQSSPAGDNGSANRAFYFHHHEGNNSKVMGFTIRNGYTRGPKGADGNEPYSGNPVNLFVPIPICDDPNLCPPYALNGADANGNCYGGAILCDVASSPTIMYCVISNCTVTGAHGGNGADGQDGTWLYYTLSNVDPCTGQISSTAVPLSNPDGQWGGKGGNGSGNGYGGAIACLNGSSPCIIDCNISGNFAQGGCGGNGGNGGTAAYTGTQTVTYEGKESGGGDAGSSIGDGMGGAIYCDGSSNATITNCTFSNNVATTGQRGTGGQRGLGNELGLVNYPRAPEGNDGKVSSYGGIAGGAAYHDTGSHVSDTNCTFSGNMAYDDYTILGEVIGAYTVGGALYSKTNSIISLDTCTFIGNIGGAVYCGSGCTVTINNTYDPNRNCSFTGNSEPNDGSDLDVDIGIDFGSGGAVYIGAGGTANLQGCTFISNSAKNDGGALECRSNATLANCSFSGNRADSDNDGSGYGGAMDSYDPDGTTLTVDVNACSFAGNQSISGGGFSSENFHNTIFTNCYFVGNTAQEGGGLDLVYGDFSVIGGAVTENTATDGDGGGFDCIAVAADINGCTISGNFADGNYPVGGNGGAINFFGGNPAPAQKVFNCLITSNSAAVDGGAIFCNYAAPNIGNCTFSGDSAGGYGGAIFSDYASDPNITDSIFKGCNNHAIHEEIFGGNAIVRYSLFYNNPDGDFYDSGTGLTYTGAADINSIPGSNNLYGDPLFVSGPLGDYYLSQIAAGQSSNSPAVDSGSATAISLGLSTYTTRTDNVCDTGQVDRGYHYCVSTSVQIFQLTASVVGGHGMVVPTSPPPLDYNSSTNIYTYYPGTVVTLTATPDSGWWIGTWSGTDNDASTTTTNTVVMSSNKAVTVKFKQGKTLIVAVGGGQPGYYSNIQDAVSDANDGDTIVVYSGTYYGGYEGRSVFIDKSVTVTSLNPDDPCCVAATIIDGYAQSPFEEGYTNDGVVFGPHTNANTILNGFTIQNCGGKAGDGLPGDRSKNHPNGYDAYSATGAAIMLRSGGGPITIKNCIIRDNVVRGGNGGNGVGADDTHNAGRGGWAGYAYGGAIYCDVNSSWTFINCQIINNYAQGGNGGNGGNGVVNGGYQNYGGNWSITGTPQYPAYNIDPGSLNITDVTDEDLWEVWGYFGDYRWYSAYGGGVFCNIGSTVTFIHCTISGNSTIGGVSGQGGKDAYSLRPEEPLIPYEIPTFGGGVYCAAGSTITFTDCTITNNIASEPNANNNHLDPYLGHGGGVCAENTAKLTFTNCTFGENTANVGGGTHFADTNPTISDCNFVSNSAFQGGGLYGENGPVSITGCNITNNEATSDLNDPNEIVLGDGGGLQLWATEANITDCNISGNQADDAGGGVFFGGQNTSLLTNCLLTNNTATEGGAISTNTFAQLAISNCTIADNNGTTSGGGLDCSYGSYANIINSIIWDNTGTNGSQITVGVSFEYDESPSTVNISYSDVGILAYASLHVDTNCVLTGFDPNNSTNSWDPNSKLHNISGDPNFIGGYLLSQIAAGQEVNSPCVDAGSDLASVFGLNTYTTRTDSIPDSGIVDMGYHYALFAPTQYELTVMAFNINGIEDANLVSPNGGLYNEYTTVWLTVASALDPNFYDFNDIIWSGTNNDDSNEPNNTVTMDSNETVTVQIVKSAYNLTVEAGPGGTVASPWSPGTYTVKSHTVVGLEAVPYQGYRVKGWIGSDNDVSTDPCNTVTITNSDKTVMVEFEQPQIISVPGDHASIQQALDAAKEGDTILLSPGTYTTSSSYTIDSKNVTISGIAPDDPCVVAATAVEVDIGTAGYFDNSAFAIYNVGPETVLNGITIRGVVHRGYDGLSGTRLGEAGYNGEHAFGGGILCYMASPTIKNCIIVDCNAIGGSGGNGYDGSGDDPNDPNIYGTDGGWPGRAYGGGLACLANSNPTVINCTFENCSAIGGNGGNGGNGSTSDTLWRAGVYAYGGRGGGWYYSDDSAPWHNSSRPWKNSSQGYNEYGPDLNSFYDFYNEYTGRGGAVFVGGQCSPTFTDCNFINSRTEGGTCGITGLDGWPPTNRVEPSIHYQIENFGGAVFCEANSSPIFTDCNFVGNTADTNYPTNNDSPYVSYGGAIAWETGANVTLNGCTFSSNSAATGGAIYSSDANAQIIDCNVSGNSAYLGGGMFETDSLATIRNCFIQNNFAGYVPVDINDTNMPMPGQGGGIYSSSTESQITDCVITDNNAVAFGGGIFFTGAEANASVVNCLVVDNQAGRDGGGLSINWYAAPLITNCTVVGNVVTGNIGVPREASLGGGIYSGYSSHPVILNSILWNNYAPSLLGREIAVGAGFEYDPRPSTVDVNYSDIKGAQAFVFIDVNCTLNWGVGNIYADPLFVTGPLGSYYLSQTATRDPNQTVNSPCVDAGSDLASNIFGVGLYRLYTTRTDEVFDTGIVDMGYHYPVSHPIALCSFSDLSHDGIVNFVDFAMFCLYWLNGHCSADNNWCNGADLTFDTHVDFNDLMSFCSCWLAEDTEPPLPNPSQWEIQPYSTATMPPYWVSMTAQTAFDAWGGVVEYNFVCVTGNCHNRGWDPNRTYVDSNLDANTVYGYEVKARNERGYENAWSTVGYMITSVEITTPPVTDPNAADPYKSTWATPPYATGPNSISMVATAATDVSGVEYYFECTSGTSSGGSDSGWQASTTYTNTGLDPCTTYSYQVRARDNANPPNYGDWSNIASATTLGQGQEANEPNITTPCTTPPTPNPSQWLTVPYQYGPDANGYYHHAMAAVLTSATCDNNPCQYYFQFVYGGYGPHDSGWQSSNVYDYAVSSNPDQYGVYRVMARDDVGNETGWSVMLSTQK